jgi:Zn-dependent protease with chaperone function
MEEPAIAAVAAHEIAHIAMDDMTSTMAIVQSFVKSIILLITLPLSAIMINCLFLRECRCINGMVNINCEIYYYPFPTVLK